MPELRDGWFGWCLGSLVSKGDNFGGLHARVAEFVGELVDLGFFG